MFKHRLRATIAGLVAVAIAAGGTFAGGASASTAQAASNAPLQNCTFKTYNKGRYLTAVGGGGRITDTIHSDATRIGSWEKFRVACNQ